MIHETLPVADNVGVMVNDELYYGGDSYTVPGKPVGTVWLALARIGEPARAELLQLQGDRALVRAQTVRFALARLRESLA